jgi:hypothetical protein
MNDRQRLVSRLYVDLRRQASAMWRELGPLSAG